MAFESEIMVQTAGYQLQQQQHLYLYLVWRQSIEQVTCIFGPLTYSPISMYNFFMMLS